MTDYPEIFKLLALGLTAGVLSGLFGIGGGLVIVPGLVLMLGFPIKVAVGTSLFVILFPTGLLGVLEYWKSGNIRVSAGLWIAAGLTLGVFVGAYYAGKVKPVAMKQLYAVFLLIVGIYFLITSARSPASRAETSAKPVPPGAVGGAPQDQAVH